MEHEAVVRGTHRSTNTDSRSEQGNGSPESSSGLGARFSIPRSSRDDTLLRSHGRLDKPTNGTDDGEFLSTDNSSSSPSAGYMATAAASASVDASAPCADGNDADTNGGGAAAAAAARTEYSVEVSYLEIYNETLRDLFNPTTPASAGGSNGGVSGERGANAVGNNGGGYASHGSGLRLREDPM